MAWRAVHDTVGRSVSLASVGDFAERLYWRLLAHSDAYGRLDGDLRKVRAQCIPLLVHVTDQELAEALTDLEETAGRILVYQIDGRLVIQIVDFEEYQPNELKRKRGASRLPEPPGPDYSGPTPALGPPYARIAYETFCKIPANGHKGGTTPEYSRPRAGQSRVEESRSSTSSSTSTEDRQNAPPADDDDDDDAFEQTPSWGAAEPERARAWLRHAATRDDVGNPIGYARRSFENGGWPSEPSPSTAAPRTVDTYTVCRHTIEGLGWDEATPWESMLEEIERIEKKHGPLTAEQHHELRELWETERATRYPIEATA